MVGCAFIGGLGGVCLLEYWLFCVSVILHTLTLESFE